MTPNMNEITTSTTNEKPRPGDERMEGKHRLAWDEEIGKWRHLPTKCKVNPFHPDWKPCPPIRVVEKTAKMSRRIYHIMVDANGVSLMSDGVTPRRSAYVTHWQNFTHHAFGKGANPIGHRPTRAKTAETYLLKEAREDADLVKFLDKNGQPKPELVLALYLALWRKILALPAVVSEFARRSLEDALADPQGAIERYSKFGGVPVTQVQMANTPQGQFVKLAIFQDNPELHPPEEQDPEPTQPKLVEARVLPPTP